ncbi:MAG: NAD-dependent DNA ligase LigA, partial [Bacteroidales bacterium]|nr:NAD-dependent DNA ligase LigA [Bacteroidales bacterium]
PPQIEGKFLHFASRKAMNINVGEVAIHQLCEREFIKNLEDLYTLDDLQLLSLDKWKGKSVENFRTSLEESKKVPFGRVLYALGIKHIGEVSAKTLAAEYKTVDALSKATVEQLIETQDVGEALAQSIVEYFKEPANIKTVEALRTFGLQFEEKEVEKVSNTLSGMTIMITGNYSISRDLMKQYIEAHGGKVGSSVSSNTTYLLAGSKAGAAKLQKAEKLGIPVISEEEFYKIANPNGESYSSNGVSGEESGGPESEYTLF